MVMDLAQFRLYFICILVFFIGVSLLKRSAKFLTFIIALFALCEVGYLLGMTDLNNYIPLSTIFKYDMIATVKAVFLDLVSYIQMPL